MYLDGLQQQHPTYLTSNFFYKNFVWSWMSLVEVWRSLSKMPIYIIHISNPSNPIPIQMKLGAPALGSLRKRWSALVHRCGLGLKRSDGDVGRSHWSCSVLCCPRVNRDGFWTHVLVQEVQLDRVRHKACTA